MIPLDTRTFETSSHSHVASSVDSGVPRSSIPTRTAPRITPPIPTTRPSVLDAANEVLFPHNGYTNRPPLPPRDTWSQHVARARGSSRPSFASRSGFMPPSNSHTGPPHKANARSRGFHPCRGFYRPT